jgi:hypothetical protein
MEKALFSLRAQASVGFFIATTAAYRRNSAG